MRKITSITTRKKARMEDEILEPVASTQEASSEIVLVTPAIAQGMLAKNKSNRDLKPWRVKEYAESIRRGEWEVNNDSIALDGEGNLLNGQHRLTAIIASNIPQRMLIVRGLSEKSQITMDIGAKRSYADHLRILKKVKYGGHFTVALRVLFTYLLIAKQKGTNGDFLDGYCLNNAKPTFAQLDRTFEAHPGLPECIEASGRAVLKSNQNPALHGGVGPFGVGIYIVREAMIERNRDPQDFERGLMTGADLKERDPRLLLRNMVRPNHIRRQSAKELLLYIHAFNLWFQEEKRGILVLQERGDLIKPLGKLPKSFSLHLASSQQKALA